MKVCVNLLVLGISPSYLHDILNIRFEKNLNKIPLFIYCFDVATRLLCTYYETNFTEGVYFLNSQSWYIFPSAHNNPYKCLT